MTYTRFPVVLLRPLRHLCIFKYSVSPERLLSYKPAYLFYLFFVCLSTDFYSFPKKHIRFYKTYVLSEKKPSGVYTFCFCREQDPRPPTEILSVGGRILLFFSVPAICAALAGRYSRRGQHIVQTVVTKGCELQFASDRFDHGCIFIAVGIGVLI